MPNHFALGWDRIKSCACCGKPIGRERPAAASVTRDADREALWCFDCWDNDPRAVEQYRQLGLLMSGYKKESK